MDGQQQTLSYSRILAFWFPLAATWLMMSLEGPFLSAVIARMAEPKFNLAAYGVAFSVGLIAEAPIIMIMAATTALVRDRDSLVKMRRFTYILNGLVTSVMLIIIAPPIFFFATERVIDLPDHIVRLTHMACVLMIPWPAAIGYRRFYQGILIRSARTRYVAYGTVVRLAFMALTASLLCTFSPLEGAHVGAASLSVGVIMEAIASRLMARNPVRQLLEKEGTSIAPLSYRSIISFYFPLALTTILALGIRPMVTFFVGQSRMAIESLAVLPVISGLVFLFICFGLSFQEVVLVFVGDRHENYRPLRNFAFVLAGATLCGLVLISFTPLSEIWFQRISGLSPQLAMFSVLPAQILTPTPGLWVWLCFQRAILMNSRHTKPIITGTALEVIVIMAALAVSIYQLNAVGTVAAAVALLIGGISATLYLFPYFLRTLAEKRSA